MIKFIRTTLLAMATLSVMPVAAQQVTKAPLPKVMNRYGKMVDMPVFGSPEANNIVPKRCGTSILENQLAKDGKRRVISSSMNFACLFLTSFNLDSWFGSSLNILSK